MDMRWGPAQCFGPSPQLPPAPHAGRGLTCALCTWLPSFPPSLSSLPQGLLIFCCVKFTDDPISPCSSFPLHLALP